eukprot:TRINITY_DN2898_c7_g1_i1.p1 TRINITY_DN2898_c7_g1~~TRINITY_DN2898_c7_g1_i1.p1  ORF type:complete len:1389 (+),score=334.42 TRINITY_DN2898_c7_g1_i1:59-4225(+)
MFGPKRQSNICVDEPNLPVFSGSSAASSPVFRTSVDGGRTIPHQTSPVRYQTEALTSLAPPSLGSLPCNEFDKQQFQHLSSPSDELNDVVGIMNHFYKSSEEHREASKTRIKLYENREQQLAKMMAKLAEMSTTPSPQHESSSALDEERQQRMRLEAKSRQLAEELVASVKRSEELEIRLQATSGDIADKNSEITARTIENTRLQHQISELCSALEDAKKRLAMGAVSSSPSESGMRDVAVMSGLLEKSNREKAALLDKLQMLEDHNSASPAINEEASDLHHHNQLLQQRIQTLESQLAASRNSLNSLNGPNNELIKELQARILTLELGNPDPESDDLIQELQSRVQSLEVTNEELLGSNTKLSIELQAAKERLAEVVSRDMSPPPPQETSWSSDPLLLVTLLEQKRRCDHLSDEVMDWKNRCVQVSRHIIHSVEEERNLKREIHTLKKTLKTQSEDNSDKEENKKLEQSLKEEKIASGERIAEILWYKNRVAELEDSLGVAEATCEEARQRISSLESARDAWWQECEVILRQMAERRKQTSTTMAELDILRKEVNELREAEKLAFQPQEIVPTKQQTESRPKTPPNSSSKQQIDLLTSQLNFARSEKVRFEEMLTTALDDGQKTIEKLERQVRERDQLLKQHNAGKKKKKRKTADADQPTTQQKQQTSQPSDYRHEDRHDDHRLSTSSTATKPVSPVDERYQRKEVSYSPHVRDPSPQPVGRRSQSASRSRSQEDHHPAHGDGNELIRSSLPPNNESQHSARASSPETEPQYHSSAVSNTRSRSAQRDRSPSPSPSPSGNTPVAIPSPYRHQSTNRSPNVEEDEYPVHYEPPRQSESLPSPNQNPNHEIVHHRGVSEQRTISTERSPSRPAQVVSQPAQSVHRDSSRSASAMISSSRYQLSSSPTQGTDLSTSPRQQSEMRCGSEVVRYFEQPDSPPPGIQVTGQGIQPQGHNEVNRVSYSTVSSQVTKNWVSTSPELDRQVHQQLPRLSGDPPPPRESLRDDRSPSARYEGGAEHLPISQLVTSPSTTARPSAMSASTATGVEVRRSTESQFIGKKDMLWEGVFENSPRSDDELAGLLDAPTTDRHRQVPVRSPITAVKINLNLSSENPPPPADELSDAESESIPHTEKVIAAVEEEVGGMLDKLEKREQTVSKREARFAEMQSNLKKATINKHAMLKKEVALQARERDLEVREHRVRETSLASIRKEKELVWREEDIKNKNDELLQKQREQALQKHFVENQNKSPGDTLRTFLEHNPSLTGNMTTAELKKMIKEELHRAELVGNDKSGAKPRVSSSPNTLTTPERTVALHSILQQFQQLSRGSYAQKQRSSYSDSSSSTSSSSDSSLSSDSSSESDIVTQPTRKVKRKPASKTAPKGRSKFTRRR